MGGVGKLGLELNRAGGLQDLVVDEVDLAFIKLDLVVLTVSENRERLLVISHPLLNFRQICLGKREDQRYRLDLGDDDETIRVRRVNDVAYVDLPHACDARDRRGQLGISKLDLRLFMDLMAFCSCPTCAFWVSRSCGVAY